MLSSPPDKSDGEATATRDGEGVLLALAVAVPSLLGVALYLGALAGGFVWDDVVLADGSGIGGGESLAACFKTAFLHHFYRPLVSVSFLLDRALWPGNAVAYHWVNLVLHGLGTAVVVLLARAIFNNTGLAATTGVLFAFHPVHLGATAWIGGRTDTLGTLWTGLFALGLVSGAQCVGPVRSRWITGSVLAYALAVFTKEQTLFLLPLIPLAFTAFRPVRGVTLPYDGWVLLLPYILVAAFYLAVGAFMGMPAPVSTGASLVEQVERFVTACFAYAELLLLPNQRVLHAYSLEPWRQGMPWTLLGGAVVIAGTVLGFFEAWRRSRPVAWLIAFTALCLVPVSNLFPLPFLLFAHYRASVAGIGVACLLAAGVAQLRWPLRGFASAPAAVTVAVLTAWYAVQVLEAIPSYRSEEQLFRTIVAYDPGSVVARYMLARGALAGERYTEATEHLEAILYYLYGSKRWRNGEDAVRLLEQSSAIRARVRQNQGSRDDPRIFAAALFKHLAFARMHSDNIDEAIGAFRTSLALQPEQPDAWHGLAWCLARKEQYVQARVSLEKALRREPTADRYKLMAQILEREGRFFEARTFWRLSEQGVSSETQR